MDIPRSRLIAVLAGAAFAAAAPALAQKESSPADTADGAHGAGGVFAEAIATAQRRCAKVYGAGTSVEAGYATGLIVSPDGLILTAQGIYLSADRLRVVLPDGIAHDARILRRSEKLQSVLLKIDAKTPDYFELPRQPMVNQGDWVLAVSNLFKVAEGKEPLSVNLGVVSLRTRISARHRTQDVAYEGDVLLVDAITSNPGASGGALVDAQGRLAGMIGKLLESTSTNTRINYAVPADLLYDFVRGADLPEVAETKPPAETAPAGRGGRAVTGIRLFTLSGKRAPAFVDGVLPGSAAQRAGLRRDDLILALDGETIRDIRDFDKAAARLQPGKEVSLVVKRKNDILALKLVAEEEKEK